MVVRSSGLLVQTITLFISDESACFYPISNLIEYPDWQCFTVSHKGNNVLDLIASSRDERDLWVTGLRHLIVSMSRLQLSFFALQQLRQN